MKLNNKDILCVLYTAKAKFIVDRNTTNYGFGMCFYIQNCISFIFNTHIYYSDIKNIIPEFIPETFGLNVEYPHLWWNIDDINSRIKAFNKLIEIYKNKIDEVDIIKNIDLELPEKIGLIVEDPNSIDNKIKQFNALTEWNKKCNGQK